MRGQSVGSQAKEVAYAVYLHEIDWIDALDQATNEALFVSA